MNDAIENEILAGLRAARKNYQAKRDHGNLDNAGLDFVLKTLDQISDDIARYEAQATESALHCDKTTAAPVRLILTKEEAKAFHDAKLALNNLDGVDFSVILDDREVMIDFTPNGISVVAPGAAEHYGNESRFANTYGLDV